MTFSLTNPICVASRPNAPHFIILLARQGESARAQWVNSELKQVTFLTTRTSTGSKVDVFHQSQPLTQSSDVTHAVRVVKNVTCLSSLIVILSLRD